MVKKFSLFSVYGIEIEYMIVDKESLNPVSIADKVLMSLNNGILVNEHELGLIAVSNELALHVIELKTNGPTESLNNLEKKFAQAVNQVQEILNKFGAMLLPTGMHPWFTPDRTLKLWPYSNNEIYDLYHKIFNCEGHGFGNLQSTHINLPFGNEEEFIKLHEAIRLILPIIPSLTSSTPFVSENKNNASSNRLFFYGKNQASIPCISGEIIPESVKSFKEYQEMILEPMYKAISPFDPNKTLQEEWLNSRGAIARFDRNAIEIRIVDSQESPLMDNVCVILIVNAIKSIISLNQNKILSLDISQNELVKIYQECIKSGDKLLIDNKRYLKALGVYDEEQKMLDTKNIWFKLFSKTKKEISPQYYQVIKKHLDSGNLSNRLLTSYNSGESLINIYKALHNCLIENSMYENKK